MDYYWWQIVKQAVESILFFLLDIKYASCYIIFNLIRNELHLFHIYIYFIENIAIKHWNVLTYYITSILKFYIFIISSLVDYSTINTRICLKSNMITFYFFFFLSAYDDSYLMAVYHLISRSPYLFQKETRKTYNRVDFCCIISRLKRKAGLIGQTYVWRLVVHLSTPPDRRVNCPAAITDFIRRGRERPPGRPRGWRWAKKNTCITW